MPFISLEEKRDDYNFLKDQIENKRISPGVFVKFRSEAERILSLGQEDFVVIREYSTDFINGEKKGRITPTEQWNETDQGYRIVSDSISDILDTISYIMDTNSNDLKFYFVCNSPDIGYPRVNGINIMLNETKNRMNELKQPGEYIPESFLDR